MELPYDQIGEAVDRCGDIWDELSACRVFITGGTGFLGRWVLATVLEANRRYGLDIAVTCITRDPDRFRAAWPQLSSSPEIELLFGDVRDFDFPKGNFKYVLHAATDTSASSEEDAFEFIESLTSGTRRVIGFAQASNARRLLFTSSGSIYGSQPAGIEKIPEDYSGACSTTDPRSLNGQSKRLAEQMCTIAQHRLGIETVIARCFAFAGPGMDINGHFAIGNFVRDALHGESIIVKGDGSPVRSYLYASDTAAWLLTLLVKGRSGTAYNVGSNEPITIADLAQRVAELIPTANGVRIEGHQNQHGFRSRYVPDTRLAQTEFGLRAWTGIDETIRRLAGWVTSGRQY